MTVKELIDLLQKQEPESQVTVSTYGCGAVTYNTIKKTDVVELVNGTVNIDAEYN